ncbi:hypothetical protein HFP57_00770 [Parasphingopyxis algicola]|uniref:hypothetical protein n=1 Tax=Parasphingopyxis algicola TaxID=2026624 RepID=UPI0015A0E1AB|nr:hypothetical protein [Parasphingopyxis algicola]QLC23706.1 hypothetical protein HFP57_00770 [Parasphingopyxis algicola]
MTDATKAGISYFALVFGAGFVLGTMRIFLLVPAVGEWTATLIELPIILAIAWFVCGWAIRRYAVSPQVSARFAMGAIALVLLLAAEMLLAIILFGEGPILYAARMMEPVGLSGLAGQLCFALFPLWRMR